MKKTLLLRGIISSLFKDEDVNRVCYDCENGIEVNLKSKNNIKYQETIITRGIDSNSDVVKKCLEFFNLFENSIMIVKEGYDTANNELVYVKVEVIKNELDCLLLRLCREFDCVTNELGISLESIGDFVFENNGNYVDVFSLNINIDGVEDKTLVRVIDGEVLCNELYLKVPSFKTSFNEGLLKCIWSLVGDYVIEVDMMNSFGVNYPFMYSIYFVIGGLGII